MQAPAHDRTSTERHPIIHVDEGRMLVKKLFKILSLLRLFRELRHTLRGHRGYGRHYHGSHYGHRDYYPLYSSRPRKLKAKHLVRELLHGRRY
jgi:hypothetical protein